MIDRYIISGTLAGINKRIAIIRNDVTNITITKRLVFVDFKHRETISLINDNLLVAPYTFNQNLYEMFGLNHSFTVSNNLK